MSNLPKMSDFSGDSLSAIYLFSYTFRLCSAFFNIFFRLLQEGDFCSTVSIPPHSSFSLPKSPNNFDGVENR